MVCELINVSSRSGVPESLQFTSILPRTLLVMVVPFLRGRLTSNGKGQEATYSLVHNRVQRLHDIKVDLVVVVAKAGFAPWDWAGKCTEIARCRSGVSSDASDGE